MRIHFHQKARHARRFCFAPIGVVVAVVVGGGSGGIVVVVVVLVVFLLVVIVVVFFPSDGDTVIAVPFYDFAGFDDFLLLLLADGGIVGQSRSPENDQPARTIGRRQGRITWSKGDTD